MKKRPNWAAGVTGSVMIAISKLRWPRGSRQRPVRTWSRCSWNQRRFSPIVAPGIRPRPLVTSRIPIPAVWKSIVETTRSARIATSQFVAAPRRARPSIAAPRPAGPQPRDGLRRALPSSRRESYRRRFSSEEVGCGGFGELDARAGLGEQLARDREHALDDRVLVEGQDAA